MHKTLVTGELAFGSKFFKYIRCSCTPIIGNDGIFRPVTLEYWYFSVIRGGLPISNNYLKMFITQWIPPLTRAQVNVKQGLKNRLILCGQYLVFIINTYGCVRLRIFTKRFSKPVTFLMAKLLSKTYVREGLVQRYPTR